MRGPQVSRVNALWFGATLLAVWNLESKVVAELVPVINCSTGLVWVFEWIVTKWSTM